MPMATSRSGWWNGSGLSSTALTTLNIAVVTPMPSAIVTTATVANPGLLLSLRSAYRKSWVNEFIVVAPSLVSQRYHRIHLRRPPRGDVTSGQGYQHQGTRYGQKREWVRRRYPKQLASHRSGQGKSAGNSNYDSD